MSEETPTPENNPVDLEQVCDELFGRDQDLRAALEVVVAAYRIHHMASVAIERIVRAEGLPEAAAKLLTAAGASKAKASYYTIEALIGSIDLEVVPLLKAEFQIQEESKRTRTLENRMADRTVSTKPAVLITMEKTTVELDRGHVMLAVGDKVTLIKGLADMMFRLTSDNELTAKPNGSLNVINLSASQDPPQIKQSQARIMRIPLLKWQYLATRQTKLRTMLYTVASQLHGMACDLIIVDDGNQLFNGVHGREPCYDLEDGLRTLRRVAADLNAAVVCLAPVPPDSPDYVSMLRTHLQKHVVFIEV